MTQFVTKWVTWLVCDYVRVHVTSLTCRCICLDVSYLSRRVVPVSTCRCICIDASLYLPWTIAVYALPRLCTCLNASLYLAWLIAAFDAPLYPLWHVALPILACRCRSPGLWWMLIDRSCVEATKQGLCCRVVTSHRLISGCVDYRFTEQVMALVAHELNETIIDSGQ